jgi:hypothetical protein
VCMSLSLTAVLEWVALCEHWIPRVVAGHIHTSKVVGLYC